MSQTCVKPLLCLMLFSAFVATAQSIAGDLDALRKEVRDPDPKAQDEQEERRRRSRTERCHHGRLACQCMQCLDPYYQPPSPIPPPSLDSLSNRRSYTLNNETSMPYQSFQNQPDVGIAMGAGAVGAGLTGVALANDLRNDPGPINDGYWTYFPSYPYQDENGYLLFSETEWSKLDLWKPKRWMGLRLSSEYGSSFGDIQSINTELLVDTSSRLGIDADQRWLAEKRSTGSYDDLWLGDANLFYRFGRSSNFIFRMGAGFNYLSDRTGSDFGPNFTLAADWFPQRPAVLSFEADLGSLGKSSLIHLRLTGGVVVNHFEPYIGFDYYDIGSFQTSSMISGIRLWF